MARFGRPVTNGFDAGSDNTQYTTLSLSALPQAQYWSIGDPANVKTPAAGPSTTILDFERGFGRGIARGFALGY